MKIGIIGRSKLTYDSMVLAKEEGHDITFIVTSKEAPEYSKTSSDFRKFAIKYDIPFLHDAKINVEKLRQLTTMSSTELCISINYNGILNEEIINFFPNGILNAHGGDLPRYRGNACQAWAIINGEEKIGLCIHRMVGGELDSGDILGRKYYPININTKIGEVYKWFERDIPTLFLEVIEILKSNPSYMLETQSKDPLKALRCYPRMPDDGRIDWTQCAEQILRLINASSEPYSGAFSYDQKGRKVTIWRASLIQDNENYLAIPGQIAQIINEGCVVISGRGKILLREVSIEDERGSPSEFFKSIRTRFS